MKIQDLLFFITVSGLWIVPIRKKYVLAGLLCLLAAIPLFAFRIFFTAERLTWYAATFFIVEALQIFRNTGTNKTL